MTNRATDNIQIIEESLEFVWNTKLNNIFSDKKLIKKVIIIAFDKSKLYVFSKIPLDLKYTKKLTLNYYLYEIKHKIIFSDKHLSAWYYGLIRPDILNYLPQNLVKENLISRPIICGSTYFEFIKKQKINQKKMTYNNPYTTYESYIATIIHEFGHVIYESYYNTQFKKLDDNIKFIKNTLLLLNDKRVDLNNVKLDFPKHNLCSETFAFCTEHYASSLFLNDHKKNLDKYLKKYIKKSLETEKKLNMYYHLSNLILDNHLGAATYGVQILKKYGSSWPEFFKNQKLTK